MRRLLRLVLGAVACLAVAAPPTTLAAVPNVVGGGPVTSGSFPFAAWIVVTPPSGGAYYCSGALVAPSWVLTAAHCVTDPAHGAVVPASDVQVTMGDSPHSLAGPGVTATDVVRYPLWDPNTIDDDWALVRLPNAAVVAPVALAAPEEVVPPGTVATIVGWGQTSDDPSSLPDALQRADLVVHSVAVCAGSYGEFDSATQLCAGTGAGGGPVGCHGDSGGPLLVHADGGWREVGVVSYGQSSCTSAPTGFARVAAARAFIDAVVADAYGSPHVTRVRTVAGETSVTVNAVVASGGMPTHARLELGTAAGHYAAESVPVAVPAGPGTSDVGLHVGGLAPGATYHVVIDVWSAVGGVRSTDVAFTPPDRTRPALALARSAQVRRGRRLVLTYAVADASRRVALAASISRGGRVLRRFAVARFSLDHPLPALTWLVSRRTRPGTYQLCASAIDVAGNRSTVRCSAVHVRR